MLGTLRDNFMSTASKWRDRKAILYGEHAYTSGELDAAPISVPKAHLAQPRLFV